MLLESDDAVLYFEAFFMKAVLLMIIFIGIKIGQVISHGLMVTPSP